MKLAALVVNHDSGAHAVACVRSWLAAARAAGFERAALRVVVVDCASGLDQAGAFAALRALGAEVVVSAENLGYAGGMQLAAARAGAADVLCVLNPDLVFPAGSLARLVRTLDERPAAIVAPRCAVDEEGTLWLPPNEPPTPGATLFDALAAVDVDVARTRSLAARAARRAAWSATQAHEASMLSGACLFVARSTVARLGVLLDPRYPLYYEDADLCRRARAHGVPLVVEPRATVAHRWSRSAGHGERYAGEPLRRMRLSRRLYLKEHHGWRGALAERIARVLEARAVPLLIHDCRDLGTPSAPPPLGAGSAADALWELSVTGGFGLCGGRVVAPGEALLQQSAWDWLPAGRYWSRLTALDDGRLLEAATFMKTAPSIEPALDGATRTEAA